MTCPPSPLAAELELAGLAALEATIVIAARALRAYYPDVDRVARPGDPPLIIAARSLLDDCDQLLAGLDNHRHQVIERLPARCRDNYHWPF